METLSRGQNVQDRWRGIKRGKKKNKNHHRGSRRPPFSVLETGTVSERLIENREQNSIYPPQVWEIIDEIIEILAIEGREGR